MSLNCFLYFIILYYMAYRSKKHFHRKHKKGTQRRGFKPQALVKDSLGMVKKTSSRVMPQVKNNLEGVGSKVINITQSLFGMFTNKSKKHRR
jgi:hypothetical protein